MFCLYDAYDTEALTSMHALRPAIAYPWPDDKQSAVLISVDVDADTPLLWHCRANPGNASLSELEQRQHGLRAGLSSLLALLDRRVVKATFFVPGFVAERTPALLSELVARGHEVALHGYLHERVADITDEQFTTALHRSIDIFERQTQKAPAGFRSPGWEMTAHMLSMLRAYDLYDSSLSGFDRPYTIGGVCELPISWAREDTVRFKVTSRDGKSAPASPMLVLQEWLFDWQATAAANGLFTLTLHDWIAGRPAQLRLLDEFLDVVCDDALTWLATGAEIATRHRRLPNPLTTFVDVPNSQ
ncbi:hypothetical protein WT03_00160 [Burkholderia stagnalis]|nr:hypothetical protein WT03_00160 [Burkholderia stagnalis]